MDYVVAWLLLFLGVVGVMCAFPFLFYNHLSDPAWDIRTMLKLQTVALRITFWGFFLTPAIGLVGALFGKLLTGGSHVSQVCGKDMSRSQQRSVQRPWYMKSLMIVFLFSLVDLVFTNPPFVAFKNGRWQTGGRFTSQAVEHPDSQVAQMLWLDLRFAACAALALASGWIAFALEWMLSPRERQEGTLRTEQNGT